MKLLTSFCSIAFLCCAVLLFSSGCTSTTVITSPFPGSSDGKYDSDLIGDDGSAILESASASVRRVIVNAFYSTYVFSSTSSIKKGDLSTENLSRLSIHTVVTSRSQAGSAVTLHSTRSGIVLLTCAHIVNFPDTVYSYFVGEDGKASPYIQSISIKTSQSNFVAGIPANDVVEVISIDAPNDLALIGTTYREYTAIPFPAFAYTFGDSRELTMGTTVFAFGFPLSNKMVSRGIVSSTNIDDKGNYHIDVVSNRGFSGGLVVAIRDGIPNIEMIGMITSIYAESYYILRPEEPKGDETLLSSEPYESKAYVDELRMIRYGITKVISTKVIQDYLLKNKEKLDRWGFNPETVVRGKKGN